MTQPPNKPTCPNCGHAIAAGAPVCPNCGWEPNANAEWPPRIVDTPIPPRPTTRSARANFGLLVAGVATGIGIMAGGGYIAAALSFWWFGLYVPIILAVVTARRYGMFALGLVLSYPLAILGAFATCMMATSSHHR